MGQFDPDCSAADHPRHQASQLDDESCSRAAAIFRAMGEPSRLRLLALLQAGEMCVTEIAEETADQISTVSQRLRLLRSERLVSHRRQGKHIYYSLTDEHVSQLISNALQHATEPQFAQISSRFLGEDAQMTDDVHKDHDHQHGPDCGHTAIGHGDHVDYLHDGHLHHQESDGTVVEHQLDVTAENPSQCTPDHQCNGHEPGHVHGPGCGHEAVPHGDHVDYLVDGHLHHPHGDHCDDHGKVQLP